jgi:hypothetical protein
MPGLYRLPGELTVIELSLNDRKPGTNVLAGSTDTDKSLVNDAPENSKTLPLNDPLKNCPVVRNWAMIWSSVISVDPVMIGMPLVDTRLPRPNSMPGPTCAVALFVTRYASVGAVQQYPVRLAVAPVNDEAAAGASADAKSKWARSLAVFKRVPFGDCGGRDDWRLTLAMGEAFPS